jgi:hypothetical protein
MNRAFIGLSVRGECGDGLTVVVGNSVPGIVIDACEEADD